MKNKKKMNKLDKAEKAFSLLKTIGYNSGVSFIIVYVICAILLLCREFVGISKVICLIILGCTFVIGIALLFAIEPLKKKSKIINAICESCHLNYFRNAVLGICFIVCCLFIKKDLYLYGQFKELLSLCWTVFGIAVSVFFLWEGIASGKIENIFKSLDSEDGKNNSLRLNEKLSSIPTILILAFIDVVMLIINSLLIYLQHSVNAIVTQTLLIFCLCVTCAFVFTVIFASSVPLLLNNITSKLKAKQSGNKTQSVDDRVFNPIYKYFDKELAEIAEMDAEIERLKADENATTDEINNLIRKRNEKNQSLMKLIKFYQDECNEFVNSDN